MLGHAHWPEFAAVSPSAWGREAWTPGEPLSRSVCSSERPPGPAQRSGPSFKARGSHFQTHTHHLINSSHLPCKSDLQSPGKDTQGELANLFQQRRRRRPSRSFQIGVARACPLPSHTLFRLPRLPVRGQLWAPVNSALAVNSWRFSAAAWRVSSPKPPRHGFVLLVGAVGASV